MSAAGPVPQKKRQAFYRQRGFRLFLLISPFVAIVFLLSYLPLFGWAYAFFDYKPGIALTWEKFAGLKYFTSMFTDKYMFQDITRVMRNTLAMSLLGIATSPLPLVFAVFLSEIKFSPLKRTIQPLTTIPNFISWVLVYAVAYAMFSVGDGFVNRLLIRLGSVDAGINFLTSRNNVWLTMLGYGIWKGLGWSSIMYFAAMSGIDQELYEAAKVDGAGRFAAMRHITLPGLLPTYFVLLILSIANFINSGMEQYFVFQNHMNKAYIEVLDLFVYNQGMLSINYSFSTAVSVLKSLVSIVLLFTANGMSRLFREQSIF
jgi:putative aldouronate transport system permease protein